jgi:Flp pilus assembly protein TadG
VTRLARYCRVLRDRSGATVTEFALLLMPLLVLIMGSLDLAYQLYAAAVLQGTVNEAARRASLEGATQTAIDAYVKGRLASIATAANITTSATSYREFTGIGNPEKIMTDTAPLGTINSGDCWIDANRNGLYDTLQGSTGLGGAEDVVNYSVTMTFSRLTPVSRWMGWGTQGTVRRSTTLQNEPYAGVVDPPKVCKT